MRTHRYRIIISGWLGKTGRAAFEDFDTEPAGPDTALTGDLDQAALSGALIRIQSFGLELVEVRRLPDDAANPGRASGTSTR